MADKNTTTVYVIKDPDGRNTTGLHRRREEAWGMVARNLATTSRVLEDAGYTCTSMQLAPEGIVEELQSQIRILIYLLEEAKAVEPDKVVVNRSVVERIAELLGRGAVMGGRTIEQADLRDILLLALGK